MEKPDDFGMIQELIKLCKNSDRKKVYTRASSRYFPIRRKNWFELKSKIDDHMYFDQNQIMKKKSNIPTVKCRCSYCFHFNTTHCTVVEQQQNIVHSNLVIRNFLVIAQLFTNANLFTIHYVNCILVTGNGSLLPSSSLFSCSLNPSLTVVVATLLQMWLLVRRH